MGDLPATANVVIIGAGFAGTATAWALQRLGIAEVIVLEREVQLGRFASGRAAGLGRQLTEDEDTAGLTVRGAAVLRTLPVWSPTGGVLSFDDQANAQAYLERARRRGVAVEPGGKELVTARWPQLPDLNVVAALWVPSDGTIDVAGLLAIYAHGVRIEIATPVVRVDPVARGANVVTARGTIAARVVVDASGAWAGELVGGDPLNSFKRHVFIMDATVPDRAPWLWHLGAGEIYLRRDGASVLASPCDAAKCPPGHQEPDLVGEAHLRRVLDECDSALAGVPITRRWACQRAYTEDRKMRLGGDPNRPWLVWAAGLGGHGATASAAIGERVAAAVVEAL
ncbi:MAG: FAD-dependent oxidoreductase [Kofleriaceae bacterium]